MSLYATSRINRDVLVSKKARLEIMMNTKSLKIACILAVFVTPVAAQDRCEEDANFSLTAQECADYGGIIDEAAQECQLSDDVRRQAREELCLGLPIADGNVTNFAPIAAPLLAVVAAVGLAGGGSSSSTTTTSTTGTN